MKTLALFFAAALGLWAQATPVFPSAIAANADLLLAANAAQTTLNGNINSSTLSITVTSTSTFIVPSAIYIDFEAIKVCSKTSTVFTVCTAGRGYDGTSAAGHSTTAVVTGPFVAHHHNQLAAEVEAIETALGVGMANVAASPMIAVGDLIYGGTAGAPTRLAGNITALNQFLCQTGSGSVSAAPGWCALLGSDLPVVPISKGGHGQTTQTAGFDALQPMTALGDTIYGGTSGSGTRLPGNISLSNKFLCQVGTGSVSAAPAWCFLASSDIPPITETWTAGTGGTTANLLVKTDSTAGEVKTLLNSDTVAYGVAASTVVATASLQVIQNGPASVIADNATTIGHIGIAGTTTGGRLRDSGQSDPNQITLGTPLIGIFRSAVSGGSAALVELTPGRFGAQMPDPGPSTLGGIESITCPTHQFLNLVSTLGVPGCAQPAFTDISGSVAAAQLPNPSASTLGGVESLAAVTGQFIDSISTGGVPHQRALLASDVPSFVETCAKYTVGFASLTTAGLTQDITLFTLPARGKIVGVSVKHTTAFSGGSISAMHVSVGDATGGTTFYTAAFDIFQATGNTVFQDTNLFSSSTYASIAILARFTSIGANVNAATAGSVDLDVCSVGLP